MTGSSRQSQRSNPLCKMASRATTAFIFLVVLMGFIATAHAQAADCVNMTVYCGEVCCQPAPSQACCATTSDPADSTDTCCSPDPSNMPSTCDDFMCPEGLASDEFYDRQAAPHELRNQCCQYFRRGCCSASENQFLDLLFRPVLGLSLTVLGVLVLFSVAMACCCVCGCLSPANYVLTDS